MYPRVHVARCLFWSCLPLLTAYLLLTYISFYLTSEILLLYYHSHMLILLLGLTPEYSDRMNFEAPKRRGREHGNHANDSKSNVV